MRSGGEATPDPATAPRARTCAPDDLPLVLALAAEFPFSARRNLAGCGIEIVRGAAVRAVQRAASGGPAWVVGHPAQGFASIEADAWASGHLEVAVWRVSTVLTRGPDERRAVLVGELLRAARTAVRRAAGSLMVLRVDVDDHVTLAAAQAAGFSVVDVELSYLGDADEGRGAPPRHHDGVVVTVAGPGEPVDIDEADRSRLVARAGALERSHWGADGRLSASASERFYRGWADNALARRWGDRLALARIGDRVIGFLSWVRDEELGAEHGLDLLGRSLGVVTEPRRGAFGAMASAVMSEGRGGARWSECETQVGNLAVNRTLSRLPGVRLASSTYVLHSWTP